MHSTGKQGQSDHDRDYKKDDNNHHHDRNHDNDHAVDENDSKAEHHHMSGIRRNRKNWPIVQFGDMAENVAVRVDPGDAQTDIYVGLEHLDPETLHLRKWGHPSDVIGQKLAFKKADVIFGRRRAYQRKLAVAEFDGICSAHAMVVRAKPKMILPEFLPFFLQSDMFMERAIEISVGSLSPTINWKTLRIQEFPLPSLEEQKRMAKILWAADEAATIFFKVASDIEKAKSAYIDGMSGLSEKNSHTEKYLASYSSRTLGEIAAVTKLAGFEFTKLMKYIPDGEIVALRALNIKNNTLDLSDIKRVDKSVSDALPRSKVYANDILITYIGAYIGDILRITEDDKYHLAPNVAKITANNEIIFPELLEWVLRSNHVRSQMRQLTTTTATPSLTMTQIRNLKVKFPTDRVEQERVLKGINAFTQSLGDAKRTTGEIVSLGKVYLNIYPSALKRMGKNV